jgi:hypothetical protein
MLIFLRATVEVASLICFVIMIGVWSVIVGT